jgi:tetratricopeptide (TPR) repeat protein
VAKGIERKFPFIKFKKPDYSKVLNDIDLSAWHNPRELWSLFRIWKSDRRAISFKDVIFSCEKAIEQYPDFAILYTIKGSIQASLQRFDDAVESFKKAQDCSIISDYDRIHILNELVTLYRKTGYSDLALDAAVRNIKLIESLSDQYSMGSIVSRIYDRMKYYAYKPEQRYKIYHK